MIWLGQCPKMVVKGAGALLLAAAGVQPALAQTRPNADLTACAAANRASFTDIAQAQESGVRRHALQAVVVARLQGLGSQLGKLKEIANKAPRNLADCALATQALVAAREQLERIVGSPQKVAECTAANQQAMTEMQAMLLAFQQAGSNVSVASVQLAAARVDVLRAAATREGPTLAECRQLANEFAEERTQLQRLAPSTAPQRSAAVAAPVAAPSPEAAASAAAQCRETQARSYNEVAQNYARLVSAGPIAAEWMAPLQSLSERLTRLHAVISNPVVPGWDCDVVAKALALARSELTQLVRR